MEFPKRFSSSVDTPGLILDGGRMINWRPSLTSSTRGEEALTAERHGQQPSGHSQPQSWDRLAASYADAVEISEGEFHLGPNGDPLDLDLGPFRISADDRVLDLGCGAGHNARVAAKRGAAVVAVDSSPVQITLAQERSPNPCVDYVVADLVDYLHGGEPGGFDRAYAIFSLEYVADLAAVFGGISRRLEPGGRFLYCDLHPIASSGDVVGPSPESFIRSANYFHEGGREFEWRIAQTPVAMRRYHRTMSTLFRLASEANLHLVDCQEPQAFEGKQWPYLDPSISEQRDLWSSVPYTLMAVFEAN